MGNQCAFRCHNVPGSFRCICPYGYALAPDGRHCQGKFLFFFSFLAFFPVPVKDVTGWTCMYVSMCIMTKFYKISDMEEAFEEI